MATTTRINLKAKSLRNSQSKIQKMKSLRNSQTALLFPEVDYDSDQSWDSTKSDPAGYISDSLQTKIYKILSEIEENKYSREIVFSPTRSFVNNVYNHKKYRSFIINKFNTYDNINIAVKLVRHYNMFGRMLTYNKEPFKFVEYVFRYNKSRFIKSLTLTDVNNIGIDKIYSNNKILNQISGMVRNRYVRRNIEKRNVARNYKKIFNNIKQNYINPYLSLYVEDGEVFDQAYEVVEDDVIVRIRFAKYKYNTRYLENEGRYDNGIPVYNETVVPEPNPTLLRKIQLIISKFINLRKRKEYRDEFVDIPLDDMPSQLSDQPCCSSSIRPEMMDDSPVVQQQEAGPVVLNALQGDEVVVPSEIVKDDFWIKNSTSDVLVNQQHASAMEILIQRFDWRSSYNTGYRIFEIDLPGAVLSENPNHPASMMFFQYAYWKGDMKVRIHLNTTPFQVGKLIFSWYYGQHFDNNAANRDNIASAIQLPHVCYSASEGCDAVLVIPYRSYRSMLCTKRKESDKYKFYLGTLTCRVFNPLTSATSALVDGYVHLSFINSQFTGIVPRHIIQPEMMAVPGLVKTAERVFNVIDKVSNMDKPNNPAVPFMNTPQFTDSFATGVNDISNVHSLKLDPRGITQHPSGSSTSGTDTIMSDIINKWGLLNSVTWNTSHNIQYRLFSLPLSPELPFNKYFQVNIKDGVTIKKSSVLPPLSAICCINAYNRGSIELKVEIICSKYHTGALIISFTPVSSNVSMTDATSSYYGTIDVGNTKEYIFKIPYINERPYNPRLNKVVTSAAYPLAPMGEVNIFVLNQLKSASPTGDHVYLNIYMRAGSDFEVAVPTSPLYTTALDTTTIDPSAVIHPVAISAVMGLASWRYAAPYAQQLAVLKYSLLDDAILQFVNMEPFAVYQSSWAKDHNLVKPFSVAVYGPNQAIKNINIQPTYIARFICNGDGNKYNYAITFVNLDSARSYTIAHKALQTKRNIYPDSPTLAEWIRLQPNCLNYYIKVSTEDSYREFNKSTTVDQLTYKLVERAGVTEPQMNNVIDPTISSLASTLNGMRMFGESFRDLKDYCRRFQPYGSCIVSFNSKETTKRISVPLSYLATDCSDKNSSIARNTTREGLIPYILSAFRFARGGIRLRMIVTCITKQTSSSDDEVFYIQHIPDSVPTSRKIVVTKLSTNSSVNEYLQSGYAYTAMSMKINNSITVDIPCYIPSNLLMLQAPNFNAGAEVLHYSLGTLNIFTDQILDGTLQFTFHYALADDFHMSDFVGFPPMLPLFSTDVTNVAHAGVNTTDLDQYELIQPEMDPKEPVASTSKQAAEDEKKQSEGLIEGFKRKVSNLVTNVVTSNVRETLGLKENEDDSVGQIIKDAILKFGKENADIIISLVSQLAHCIANPQMSTFILAMMTLLTHLGLHSYSYIGRFTKWFSKLFSSSSDVTPEMENDSNKTEKESVECVKRSIIMSIVDMVSSTFGKSLDYIRSFGIPNFSSALFTNVRFGALTINAVIQVFKNLIEVVPKIFKWIGKKLNPQKWLRWLMSDNHDLICKWISDVEWVTDPNNLAKVRSESRYCQHVELLVMVGRDINIKLHELKDNNLSVAYFTQLCKKLDSVYQDIAVHNLSVGAIGIEPFCIAIHGQSQVGKTYISKALACELLKGVGFKTNEALFYTRPLNTKHWDGVERQPCCLMDDFLQIKMPESACDQISDLMLLKSKATFSPPRANVEDKGKKYNPLIVLLTSNEAYPAIQDGALAAPEAWQNRRDVLIEAKLRPEYTGKLAQEISPDVLDKFDHLHFEIHTYRSSSDSNDQKARQEVLVPCSETDLTMIKIITLNYFQLCWYLKKKFAVCYERIRSEFLKDLELQNSFLPSADADFAVNLDNYRKYLIKHRLLLNEREKKTLELVGRTVDGKQCDICGPVCICGTTNLVIEKVGELTEQVQPEMSDVCVNEVMEKILLIKPTLTQREKSVINSLKKSECIKFLKKPCIHNLLIMTADVTELMVVENDGYKLCSINSQKFYETKTEGCCDSDKDVLCLIYRSLADCPEIRDHFILEDKSPMAKIDEQFAKFTRERREKFMKWVSLKVEKRTWLGSIGSKLFKMIKPALYILGVLATIYVVTTKVDVVSNSVSSVNKYIKSKLECNRMFGSMIKSHNVTHECLNGCNICGLGEMAYTDRLMSSTKKKVQVKPKNQAEMSVLSRDVINRKLKRNYFFLVATPTDTNVPIYCRCLGLTNRCFIAIDHYFDKIKSLPLDTKLEYQTAMVSRELYMAELKMYKIKDSALIVGELPNYIPSFTNIVNFFASSKMIPNLCKETELYVCNLPLDKRNVNSYDIAWHSNVASLHSDQLHIPHIVDESMPDSVIQNYFRYQTSGQGLCGSVLISDANIPAPIIGMHVAGAKAGGCGYSEAICRETLENLLELFTPKPLIIDAEIEGQMFNDTYIKLDTNPYTIKSALYGEFNFMGTVASKYAYRPPVKSKCTHSIAYNKITKSTYDVPHLSPNDERFEGSPMVNGCLHHTKPCIPFKKADVDLASTYIRELILAKVKPVRHRIGVLSINESICGIPEIPNFDAMEMDTSEGFPFSSLRPNGEHDKKWLFDLEITEYGYKCNKIDPLLMDVINRKQKQRESGTIPMTIFTDCLKDLKLPREKCHKTRIFSISPVDFTIQFRQYFYDFTIAFQNARFDVESAVGINVDSYEWHNMVQLLLDNNTKFICGDYSKFGPRLMSQCVVEFFDIVIDWYKHNGDTSFINERIRKIMAHEIAFSMHLMLNMVYQVYCGAPSGSPITTLLNNGVNMFYIRIAYLLLSKNSQLSKDYIYSGTLAEFRKNVCVIFYGDDLIMTVKDHIIDWFNATTISNVLAKYDIVFTDALKTGSIHKYANVFSEETSFLKRTIKRHQNRPIFVAAMDKRAIEETCNWIFLGHIEPEASVIASEAMLLNAHGHGEKYYDALRSKVMEFWQSYGIVPAIPVWREVDERIYG